MELNEISGTIINAACKVHTALGPGLLEEPYKQCLAHVLRQRGFDVKIEHPLPVIFETVKVEVGYRLDLLVSILG